MEFRGHMAFGAWPLAHGAMAWPYGLMALRHSLAKIARAGNP